MGPWALGLGGLGGAAGAIGGTAIGASTGEPVAALLLAPPLAGVGFGLGALGGNLIDKKRRESWNKRTRELKKLKKEGKIKTKELLSELIDHDQEFVDDVYFKAQANLALRKLVEERGDSL